MAAHRDTVPIVTEEERFQNVKKAEIRHFLDRSAGFALLAGLDWLQFFTINFDRWVFSQTWLLLLAGLTFMCLFYLLQLGGLFVWSRRAKRELESRGSIYYGQRKSVRAANEIWTLVIMGLLIYCAGDIMSRDSIIMLIIAVMIVFGVRIVMIYMRPSWEAQMCRLSSLITVRWEGSGNYLVMYDEVLLVLSSDTELDDAQIQTVREKLGVM